ncbi:hypothetical protein J4E81_003797 [Alternaria sp. BMP 2799]|nr:hypothetical protein J4E81_003797 [Alternaria sp. BMP 2799]
MRHSVPKSIALGLLSAYILQSSGKPIIPIAPCQNEVDCSHPFNNTNWPRLARTDGLPPALDRRASGGGRPTKPNDNSPNAPHVNPDQQNTPSDAGDQQGESGGFSEQQETSGGFSDSQETEGGFNNNGDDTGGPGSSSQPAAPDSNAPPANPNPAPNAPAANNPGQPNAVQYPPSARNNRNQPAASANDPFDPEDASVPVINVATRANQFRQTITQDGLTGQPWFFYSGLDRKKKDSIYKRNLEDRLQLGHGTMPSMNNVLPNAGGGEYAIEYNAFQTLSSLDYYWAANSKAYAQAVEGRVYVVLPSGHGVNQPYPDKGSNWWTFEVPDLTRNARVDSITVVPVKEDTSNVYMEPAEAYHLGEENVIWRRGDEPIGFPASELHQLQRPDELWETVQDVYIPSSP